MSFSPDENGTFMQWTYAGSRCHGTFHPNSSVATLIFPLKSATVTISYRVMGPDTMAVCIVEVDGRHTPTIQYGNMYRLQPEAVRAQKQAAEERAASATGAVDDVFGLGADGLDATARERARQAAEAAGGELGRGATAEARARLRRERDTERASEADYDF
jgi:hypothetical protein